ncbi:MAG: ATP-binding protein [Acidobacteriota bacterium]
MTFLALSLSVRITRGLVVQRPSEDEARSEAVLLAGLVGAITLFAWNGGPEVAARRRTEEELEQLSAQNRMILSSAADALVGVNALGRTTFVNPAASQLLGWAGEEMIGRCFDEVVHQDREGLLTPCDDCPLHQTLKNGLSVKATATYWTRSGAPVEVELTSQPMCDTSGQIVGAVVTFRDITQRRVMERMKDEFISVVSHELRTPLASIVGSLALISGGKVGEIPTKMARMLEIAVANTNRLVRLVNDILDIERMASGQVTIVRQLCRVDDLIHEAVDAMRLLAEQASVQVEQLSSQGVLFADRDRLLQTLTNLLGNAIKFSPRGGVVTVVGAIEGAHIRFSVQDRGRGIPAENLEAIFERFQQVDASDSRDKGGSGLGLAICRGIVTQHGGEIWAESDYGKGSRFVFVIPRVQRTVPTPAAPECRTVLVCEDDQVIRDVEIELVEGAGYRAIGFSSGEALLASAEIGSADAILLDMGLPGLDGLGVIAELQARPDAREIPVVVVSGSLSSGPTRGVSVWLTKPLDAGELLRGLEEALRQRNRAPISDRGLSFASHVMLPLHPIEGSEGWMPSQERSTPGGVSA